MRHTLAVCASVLLGSMVVAGTIMLTTRHVPVHTMVAGDTMAVTMLDRWTGEACVRWYDRASGAPVPVGFYSPGC